MQEAIPYRTYVSSTSPSNGPGTGRVSGGLDAPESVPKLVVENAVVVFGRRGCCMSYVVKRLLLGHGVNPAVFEVDEAEEAAAIDQLSRIDGKNNGGSRNRDGNGAIQLPTVFVGGKFFGGLDRVMATHISGELVPILKDAGALWL